MKSKKALFLLAAFLAPLVLVLGCLPYYLLDSGALSSQSLDFNLDARLSVDSSGQVTAHLVVNSLYYDSGESFDYSRLSFKLNGIGAGFDAYQYDPATNSNQIIYDGHEITALGAATSLGIDIYYDKEKLISNQPLAISSVQGFQSGADLSAWLNNPTMPLALTWQAAYGDAVTSYVLDIDEVSPDAGFRSLGSESFYQASSYQLFWDWADEVAAGKSLRLTLSPSWSGSISRSDNRWYLSIPISVSGPGASISAVKGRT
jgi:hypothetical protein